MSGRPENWTRACTRRDYWTRRRRVWFLRLLPSSRFASGGFLRPHDAYVAAGRRHQRSDYQRSIQISELCCPSCLHTSWFARPPSGGLEAATDYKQVLACVRTWPYGVDRCNKKGAGRFTISSAFPAPCSRIARGSTHLVHSFSTLFFPPSFNYG